MRRQPATALGRLDRDIQPPLVAWAWAEVADRSPDDPGFRAEGLEALRRHHAWLDRERAEGDGLIGILQPDESGIVASPAYDRPSAGGPTPTRGSSWRCAPTARAARITAAMVDRLWDPADGLLSRAGRAGSGFACPHGPRSPRRPSGVLRPVQRRRPGRQGLSR